MSQDASGGDRDPGEEHPDLESGPSETTEIKREFLVQVVLLNLAILALALGAMLLYFRWWTDMGAGLVIIGLVALLAQLRRYRENPPND